MPSSTSGSKFGGLREDVDAVLHVRLGFLVLLGREPALFLEQVARQLDLADVEQQPDLRELRELRAWEIPRWRPNDGEVHRDLQAVAVGGDVLLAKARDPHQRLGIAHDALDHVVDDLLDALDLEALPEADVGDELVEQARGAASTAAWARGTSSSTLTWST